jgi:hypothetical protein
MQLHIQSVFAVRLSARLLGSVLTRLLALRCAGEAADQVEQRPAAESAQRVMRVLRAIYARRGVEVPAPLQVCPPACCSKCLGQLEDLGWVAQRTQLSHA